MAQFLTLLSILLLVAVFNPIVCPTSQLYNERQDRAPHIKLSEHSQQYVGDTYGSVESRLRKTSAYKDNNNPSYRNQEQLPPPPIPPLSNAHNPAGTNVDTSTDSLIDQRIRMVFKTDFEPDVVYVYNNTTPFRNPIHFNAHTDQMVGDQPDPYISSSHSDPSPSDKEFFKVQRGPNGKLSLVYKKDLVPKMENDTSKNYTTEGPISSSNNDTFGNRFQTHFPTGLPLAKVTVDTSTTSAHPDRESVHYFPVRVKETDDGTNIIECLEGDDSTPERKTYCTKLRNYPDKKRIEQLINEKFPHYKPFFNDDLVLPENISHRMDGPIEEYLCNTRRRTIFPQAGVGDEFDWFFIVNTDEFKQGILIEECVETDEICGEKNGISVPNNYKALCRQQYVYRSLLTYRNASIEKAQFKFPSCCKCVLLSGLN